MMQRAISTSIRPITQRFISPVKFFYLFWQLAETHTFPAGGIVSARLDQSGDLFARRAARVIFHVQQDQDALRDRLQPEEVEKTGQRL